MLKKQIGLVNAVVRYAANGVATLAVLFVLKVAFDVGFYSSVRLVRLSSNGTILSPGNHPPFPFIDNMAECRLLLDHMYGGGILVEYVPPSGNPFVMRFGCRRFMEYAPDDNVWLAAISVNIERLSKLITE